MEANACDVNHMDSDVLLPPRKRLLACLKRQNSDVNGNSYSPSNCNSLHNLDARISYLLRAHLSNENPSQEEIVAASRSAAEVAVRAAMAARAAAEEKAIVAAKAMAAAKKALELVATIDDDQEILTSSEQQLKKPNDEELARKLHQTINSSPRITKVPSYVKSHKHKKLKRLDTSEHGISPSSNGEVENTKRSKMENGEEDIARVGRKRGRMKLKKLPLSICQDRDQNKVMQS